MPVVETRRNYIANPRLETWSGWANPSNAHTLTSGGVVDVADSTGAGGLLPYQSATAPAAAGEVWSESMDVTVPAGRPAVTMVIAVVPYGGAQVLTYSPEVTIQTGTTQRLTVTSAPLPAGTNGIRLIPYLRSAAAVGRRLIFSNPLQEKAPSPGDPFSGATPAGPSLGGSAWDVFSWDGTPDASTSTMVRNRRLTPLPDMAPVPRVLIDAPMSLFPAGAATVSFTRTSEGVTHDVRGGQRLPATVPAIVTDPEPGFGVVSTYTVVGRNSAGDVIGTFPVGTVTLEYSKVVIQQPLDPRLAVEVERLAAPARTIRRSTPGELVYPEGQSRPGLVGLGPRRGVQDLTLEVRVQSNAAADMLQATLGTEDAPQLPVWLVRTPPGQRIPRVLFCHVPELVEQDVSWYSERVVFAAEVTEVRPPAAGIAGSGLTYSDVGVFYSTYSALGAAYATYSDIARDTSLVGAANA